MSEYTYDDPISAEDFTDLSDGSSSLAEVDEEDFDLSSSDFADGRLGQSIIEDLFQARSKMDPSERFPLILPEQLVSSDLDSPSSENEGNGLRYSPSSGNEANGLRHSPSSVQKFSFSAVKQYSSGPQGVRRSERARTELNDLLKEYHYEEERDREGNLVHVEGSPFDYEEIKQDLFESLPLHGEEDEDQRHSDADQDEEEVEEPLPQKVDPFKYFKKQERSKKRNKLASEEEKGLSSVNPLKWIEF